MGDFDLVTAADVRLMQGLAQRITAIRPDLVNSDATFGELAWIWGKGHACDGGTWPRRLWCSGDMLVAWGWAYLPHRVRRSDGSVTDVTGAYLGYQVHPGHAALVDDVIGWYEAVAAGIERTVVPRVADEFALKRWAAHGYETDPASLGDAGSWTQLNERDRGIRRRAGCTTASGSGSSRGMHRSSSQAHVPDRIRDDPEAFGPQTRV